MRTVEHSMFLKQFFFFTAHRKKVWIRLFGEQHLSWGAKLVEHYFKILTLGNKNRKTTFQEIWFLIQNLHPILHWKTVLILTFDRVWLIFHYRNQCFFLNKIALFKRISSVFLKKEHFFVWGTRPVEQKSETRILWNKSWGTSSQFWIL